MAEEIRTCNVNDATLQQSAAMLKTLRLFREDGYLCDTYLFSRLDTETDGDADNGNFKKIMAHAVVLAAFSPLLAQQLVKSHSGLYTIQTSMSKEKLKSFIEDIYKGVNSEDCQASLFNDFFTEVPEVALSNKIPRRHQGQNVCGPEVIIIEPDKNKDDGESEVPISSTKQTHESEQTLTVKHVEAGTQQQSMLRELSIMKNDQLCCGENHVDALVQVTRETRQSTGSASATSSSLDGLQTEQNLQKSNLNSVKRHNLTPLLATPKPTVSGGCSVGKQSAAVTQKPSHIQKRHTTATAKKTSTLTTSTLESKHLKCRNCSIMCKSKKNRAKHEMSCYGKKVASTLFMCRVCNSWFKNKGNKDSHEQFCLKSYARVRCHGCAKPFPTQEDLRRHIDSQKVDEILCMNGCRKRFRMKCLARAHRCYWSYPYDMYDGW